MLVAARRAPWQNPRILSTLVLVFVAGGVSGAVWMQLGLHDRLHHSSSREVSRNTGSKINLKNLQSQLDLSDDQSGKIAVVLEDYSQYYQSLQDQLDDLRSTGKSRILQILNPNQR